MSVRVRFAPSPTGFLHIGSARTALFNWLYARRMQGQFLLRIEDTDLARNKKEYEEDILSGLKWLGMDWDEKLVYQSQRSSIYQEHIDQLLSKGLAYEKDQAVFLKMPTTGEIVIQDLIRGNIKFNWKDFKDQVLRKSDGSPTYQFAVTVDDALMEITHVIRGEDHLSNTPKQIQIYQSLGFKLPQFAHIPLILAPDRSKLSKRHGAVSITEYQKKGFLSAALMNYLALLGWTPESFPNPKNELMSVPQLIERFDLSRIGKSGAIFDIKKLSYINGQILRSLPFDELFSELKNYLSDSVLSQNTDWQKSFISTFQDSLELAKDIQKSTQIFATDFHLDSRQVSEAETVLLSQSIKVLDLLTEWNEAELAAALQKILEQTGFKKKDVLMPLREFLTGLAHGVAVEKVLFLLGKPESLRRLKNLCP